MPNLSFQFPASSLEYLTLLKENNNRDWFNAHKEDYLQQQALVESFGDALLLELNRHDVIETASGKKSLHRIYRDTRFSKEKIPYKNHWSGSFSRATKQRRGGYYFHIEPGNTFIGGGFQQPNATDIRLIREDISFDDQPLREILNSASFVNTFGSLRGEQLKTTPKGFDAANKGIDLLRYKQFLLVKRFTDQEVLAPSFLNGASEAFRNMRPFFDYMSNILTIDVNGFPVQQVVSS